LIAHNELLSFLSRHTLAEARGHQALREVPLKELQLHRKLGVTYRRSGYLSPAARRLLNLLRERGRSLFVGAGD
jgi:DNA-binding transcriptional LysR family regulator